MPNIFDNIEAKLLDRLLVTARDSHRADFCVGYFNLRGWRLIGQAFSNWQGDDDNCCRVLIGMPPDIDGDVRRLYNPAARREMDNAQAMKLRKRLVVAFRDQLMAGIPENADEAGLRQLRDQLSKGRVRVKVYLAHPLHAKLYLLFRSDTISPMVGYLGSSNLTLAGLKKQGELNIDVVEGDACQKLSGWFDDRWQNQWCLDISKELVEVIDESWAGGQISPYEIYVKIAWHLSEPAREGLTEYRIPHQFKDILLDFQEASVKIAANHINKRGGVMIGDVVGLGKTLIAACLAKLFENHHDFRSLIVCPKNLVEMWEKYVRKYDLDAQVMSIGKVQSKLGSLRRYRMVIVDESHNLRNKDGKRHQAISRYIRDNESKCILLSATPYNKSFLDLSGQLRLFIDEDQNILVRPEKYIGQCKSDPNRQVHSGPLSSLAAFEKSENIEDWQELMRMFLVRRTRTFIKKHYAEFDQQKKRHYIIFRGGQKNYFPARIPKKVPFEIDEQYARLFDGKTVDTINSLILARYNLYKYLKGEVAKNPPDQHKNTVRNLQRASNANLMGFCRTNLLKRLESSGFTFQKSLHRHILRNQVYLHALANNLEIPIGSLDPSLMDTVFTDQDRFIAEDVEQDWPEPEQARALYELCARKYRRNFDWLPAGFFGRKLADRLQKDIENLERILEFSGPWKAERDAKLAALVDLVGSECASRKVIVFSQFADTVDYLAAELQRRRADALEKVTGATENPTEIAERFSPKSNNADISPGQELRVLITTDVLSEGQNLQDCAIVVNYDLPWTIIRLVQRAGRVDRIGQEASETICYSFMPADGIEKLLDLRKRVRERLKENAAVIGTDEQFFEDDDQRAVTDIYNEKAGILDADEDDSDIDLASYAYQIWKGATENDPALTQKIEKSANVVCAAKRHEAVAGRPGGALVYLRSGDNDILAWIDRQGAVVSESQFEILQVAQCRPDTPALPHSDGHHEIVGRAVRHYSEKHQTAGQLGSKINARYRVYERLKQYSSEASLLQTAGLKNAIGQIYRYPLQAAAREQLNKLLRMRASDNDLAESVEKMYNRGGLCIIADEKDGYGAQIICSLGLIEGRDE